MDIENSILFSECEISYFDEDPDEEENRAGDGYYYRLPGEDGWSGPWHSEEEAEEELRVDVAYKESEDIKKLFLDEGWILARNDIIPSIYVDEEDQPCPVYMNKIDGRWFEAKILDFRLSIEEKNQYENNPIFNIVISHQNVSDDDQDVIYGRKFASAKGALEALKEAMNIDVPIPKM